MGTSRKDADQAKAIERPGPRKPLKVRKWIDRGELRDGCRTSQDILEDAGELLDHACAHDIVGGAKFIATDGKRYVVHVEAVIDVVEDE